MHFRIALPSPYRNIFAKERKVVRYYFLIILEILIFICLSNKYNLAKTNIKKFGFVFTSNLFCGEKCFQLFRQTTTEE